MSKLVFITGASSGIGQALAWQFHQQGYHLALMARRTAEVESWAAAQGISAENYKVYGADVTQTESLIHAAESCIAQQGLPDVVIANAGISVGMDTTCREDIEVMARVFATNNIGMVATFHPFVSGMVARAKSNGLQPHQAGHGGTLVGIGSVAGIRGLPGHGAYSASKAAAISYCESLRGELGPLGVQVVTICPGYIDTPLTRNNPYSMPFLMSAEAFARDAFKAIEAGTSYQVIPWQMGIVAKGLRLLPNRLFDTLFAKRKRKPRG